MPARRSPLLPAVLLAVVLTGCGTPPASYDGGGPTRPTDPGGTAGTAAPAGTGTAAPAGTKGAPSAAPAPAATARPSFPPPSAAGSTPARRYVFPVPGAAVAYHPTHAKYPATDLFADCGTPVVAVTDGAVLEVSRVDRFVEGRPDGPYNGGLSVSILGDDGVRYYGSHLAVVQAGIEAGLRVRAGQRLGTVGRTGNANNVCHLHFGISPPCAGTGDWQVRRGVVWPAPYLDSWRRAGHRSPVAKVTDWQRRHACRP